MVKQKSISHLSLSVASTALSTDIEKLLKLILAASRVNCFKLLRNHESLLTFGVVNSKFRTILPEGSYKLSFINTAFTKGTIVENFKPQLLEFFNKLEFKFEQS